MSRLFKNDYSELGHPRILDALYKYSNEQNTPYGFDYHSNNAKQYILDIFDSKHGDVFFLAGGTQTNMVFISYCLKHYEGVISCTTGHINVHETAAVEGAGYKIITVDGKDGKLHQEDVEYVMKIYQDVHMVKPRMVYISNSTEIGTIYSYKELKELYDVCKKYHLYLFIDGARLGSAITSKDNDLEPRNYGSLCDAFYIGGTKNGLLYGEALVINNKDLAKDFRYHIKNKGAMLAKGYALGIMFEEAFKDGLYFELAKHANDEAQYLYNSLLDHKVDVAPSYTNQIFAKFDKKSALKLIDEFGLEKWGETDQYIEVRFVTSFLTTHDDVNALILEIERLLH